MTRRSAAFWALALAFGLFTHLHGLGRTALWQDEAETAVLARRVLKTGLPRVDDGVNLVSQNQGRDHDARGLWDYSPWLPIYLAAGSIGLLGPGTFAARLPFALCALACLPLLFSLSRRWSGSEGTARLAVVLTLLSVPWLLFARQCRLYPLAALLALYLWWAYEEFLAERPHARLHVLLASAALFHASFLVFFAVAGGLALHFLAVEARRRMPERSDVTWAALIFLALLPGVVYFRVLARAGGAGGVPVSYLGNLRALTRGLDLHVLPLLALPGVLLALGDSARRLRPLALLMGSLLTLVFAPQFFFRYLVVFIPLASHLLAEALSAAWRRLPAAAAAAGALLLATNAWSVGAWLRKAPVLDSGLADMAAELSAAPKDPVTAAVELLRREGRPGELALVSYPDLPFMYYTPLKVVGGGQGWRRVEAADVAWVVVRGPAEKAALRLDWSRYERVPLGVPDWPWGNRPDPDRHVFRTVAGAPEAAVYRRKRQTDSTPADAARQ
ncbi:MAG: hypothetical protein KGL53_01900 [Elusimicrobia bacterium]|nr:hypothetical protein [Elusimicrobiota bacterium]